MSLNTILRVLNKALCMLVQRNNAGIKSRLEEAVRLENEAEVLLHEKRQALVVIENLNNLLGGK